VLIHDRDSLADSSRQVIAVQYALLFEVLTSDVKYLILMPGENSSGLPA
jgi:hypothetical protein